MMECDGSLEAKIGGANFCDVPVPVPVQGKFERDIVLRIAVILFIVQYSSY